MRFAILGAGAIGAYLGAALARGGADVVLIARGAQLEALRRDGVRVLSPRGDFEAKPPATDDLAAVAGVDVVVIALKAYSIPALAPRLGELLDGDTAVLPAQNGVPWWFFQSFGGEHEGTVVQSVDPDGVVTRAIEPRRVIGCVSYPATELVEPGVVQHVEGTRFTIGEPDGSASERCRLVAEAFEAGGLKCPVEPQIRGQLWLKLIGNVAFNTTTALTGASLGELALVPETRRARARDHGGVRRRRRRARDRAAGVARAAAPGGDRRRRPPHLDAAGLRRPASRSSSTASPAR